MDEQPTQSSKPTVDGEDFIHIQDLNMESLSNSMVRIDEPSDAPASATSPPPEAPLESDRRPLTLPEELSRNVVVLSCDSTAEGGVCDVYLVGTAHVSEESSREVQAIVNFLKPEVEIVEDRVKDMLLQIQQGRAWVCDIPLGKWQGFVWSIRDVSSLHYIALERARRFTKKLSERVPLHMRKFIKGFQSSWSVKVTMMRLSSMFFHFDHEVELT